MAGTDQASGVGGSILTIAFIDIDGLKAVNDRHGRAAGDRLLRLAAETLQAHLRPYDIVTRYGGDEFLCAMPNVNEAVAGERLAAVAATLSAAESGHSISFGLAEQQPTDGLQDLVRRADANVLATRRSRRHNA